ncbi:MAG: hypothetical protein EWV75_17780 [Microcystis wesenbergii Mw_QC_S_20081001_S30D]|uniref:Uncharacterized protein n=2 Tax=Microcystis wesenbergii TaxID=44823 RepID=A0A552LYL1_9CHRO|nr:MAG: hypothetical protein EWV75_17780 [Microcystis wesenbergii Mw_QC_S_20081001_S30D]TRU99898.1 MAG: hypothetical protein EWV73_12490 [Microcystis wesenbergii Mw_QC_B_20070930_S4D]TRV01605.1 MAG: hypothetical protein EWV74_10355 [Microcystis wesenbergii Mw_QC_S_20081001_S30]TRV09137.1 MAG: hypothetical protein EWV89_19550 [Microcystis wesenbergii Mw_QC_B_20070930_S4]TRV25290.1 MAG: hypothetical protein EWV88_08035 [Microcystis wesenbergii Mw_MB_S_20031200_S109D]
MNNQSLITRFSIIILLIDCVIILMRSLPSTAWRIMRMGHHWSNRTHRRLSDRNALATQDRNIAKYRSLANV